MKRPSVADLVREKWQARTEKKRLKKAKKEAEEGEVVIDLDDPFSSDFVALDEGEESQVSAAL